MSPLTFSLIITLFSSIPLSLSNPCGERCGPLSLPFPFHLAPSCGPPIPAFRLSCDPSNTSLRLSPSLRVLSFRPSSSSLLLDYSKNASSSCDRWYSDLSHSFDLPPFLGVTAGNILRLYDCEDSSICRPGCDIVYDDSHSRGCDGSGGCCYPLADGSAWKAGDGFGVFSKEFGCRGFSSWVPSAKAAERGIEMEWAVPRGVGNGTECARGAAVVNATAVRGGVRCACGPGLAGDGFAAGTGCFKPGDIYGDCSKGRLCKKKVAVVAGLIVSICLFAAAIACYFLLRCPCSKRYRWEPKQTCIPKIFAKACRTRLFTYRELNEATRGFDQEQKLADVADGTMLHPGVLCDGSMVAVQRVRCETQQTLDRLLHRVELVSSISHKNIARIVGCCVSSGRTLLLVHESFPGGTLADLLRPGRDNAPLSWYRRINIATEIASALAHLQSDVSPPVRPHSLKSSDVFVLPDYSVKIASYKLISAGDADVARSFGLLLMELIVGSGHGDVGDVVIAKMRERRFQEMVDPGIRFGEQLPVQCEQIERLAVFAVHCSSRRELCMVGAAKEFVRIVDGSGGDGGGSVEPALEVTFSNSSLLQMISVSPDSLYLP